MSVERRIADKQFRVFKQLIKSKDERFIRDKIKTGSDNQGHGKGSLSQGAQ